MKNTLLSFNAKVVLLILVVLWNITNHAKAQKNGDFRSIKSGLWTDTTVWETYKDSGWINAMKYPTYHDKHITIRNDTVTIQGMSLDVDQVIIDSGLLYLKQHAILHLRNTSGNDLINKGTINIYSSTIDLQNNATLLNDVNGTILFQPNDSITGSGNLTNKNSLNLHAVLLLPGGVIFNQLSGSVSGNGSLSIADTMNENKGDVTLPLTILNGGVLNINTVSEKKISGITNNGTINWKAGNISFYSKAIFTNNAMFNIYDQGSILNIGKVPATLNNTGTGRIEKFADTYKSTSVYTDLNNAGSLIINRGSLLTYGSFHDDHIFMLTADAYFMNFGKFYADPSESLQGSGTFENDGTETINYIDTLPATMDFTSDGVLQGSGQLYVKATSSIYGTCALPVTILKKGFCTFFISNLLSPFTNNGTTTLYIISSKISAEIINNGLIKIDSKNDFCTLNHGSANARFINNGALRGLYVNPSRFIVNFPFENRAAGSLEGVSILDFEDTLINEGAIDPGLVNPGQLPFFYSPFQSSTITNIRIGKDDKGKTKADNMFIYQGITKPNGTLNLYQTSGDVDTGYYTIIKTYGFINDSTVKGKFSQVNKPDNWDLIYTNISVVVHVKAASGLSQPIISGNNEYFIANSLQSQITYSIFPNPASAAVTIQFNNSKSEKYTIELFDVSGKKLQYKKGVSAPGINRIKMDVSKYSPGSYLLKMIEEGHQETASFIKQ